MSGIIYKMKFRHEKPSKNAIRQPNVPHLMSTKSKVKQFFFHILNSKFYETNFLTHELAVVPCNRPARCKHPDELGRNYESRCQHHDLRRSAQPFSLRPFEPYPGAISRPNRRKTLVQRPHFAPAGEKEHPQAPQTWRGFSSGRCGGRQQVPFYDWTIFAGLVPRSDRLLDLPCL